jgi:hypothetical protein
MSRTTLISIVLALAALATLTSNAPASGPVGPGTIVAPTTPPPPVPPPPPAPTPAYLADPLTRIYRGDDGGALYLRQLGTKVFGFGEHPGHEYAYVLSGSIAGDRITGSWWDVPKGTRRTSGTLDLRWTQVGARLVHAGGDVLGPKVFTSISADGIPWPVMQAAGFQTMSANDPDGVFVGDDGSRHYVRELSGDTIWVAERAAQPDERPGWVSVFVGRRKPGGVFGGTYVDVPKGIERKSGAFGAALLGSKRELVLEQTGTDRTRRLGPDYALDWDRFVGEIAKSLNGNVVGYAYAMTKNGGIIRSGAWGSRRLGVDGGTLPFTTHTKAQTASAAKLVSAVAIVKALHDRGLDVDARVKPFLPSCMTTAKSISTLTFRDILDHTSGLPGARGSGTVESCNGEDPYECLLKILKAGRTQTLSPAYNNKAYDLLRLLVPLVADHQDTEAMYDFWKCKNTKGVLHRKLSERFVRYLLDDVLGPAGSTASFYPGGDFSLNYKCKRRTILWRIDPCAPPTGKGAAPRIDFFERSGSGKMTISVLDYIRFLSALDRGLIVPKGLVETMKTGRLGFDSSSPYAWKNGGCPDFEGLDRTCSTVAMIFPGDIQAYVAVNSDLSRLGGSIQTIVARAFNAALR